MFHGFYLIWTRGRALRESGRLVPLLRLLCNDVIRCTSVFLLPRVAEGEFFIDRLKKKDSRTMFQDELRNIGRESTADDECTFLTHWASLMQSCCKTCMAVRSSFGKYRDKMVLEIDAEKQEVDQSKPEPERKQRVAEKKNVTEQPLKKANSSRVQSSREDVFASQAGHKSWAIEENLVFARLDAFLERLYDGLDLLTTVTDFGTLEEVVVGGNKGKTLTGNVQQIFGDFLTAFYAVGDFLGSFTNIDYKGFDEAYHSFRCSMRMLERRLA